jgi:hypothetical protein
MEKLLSHTNALKFIFAGKSLFTLKNNVTGNRHTFKIKAAKDKATNEPNPNFHFVSLRTKGDGQGDYLYTGCISNRNHFFQTSKSKIAPDHNSVAVIKYVIAHLTTGNLNSCVEIWHEGKCGRCGRVLTVPESIESGIGPECAKWSK